MHLFMLIYIFISSSIIFKIILNCKKLVRAKLIRNIGEYYVKKEKDFKRSFGEEKARVKLYKSGKHWVKAGIRELQLLRSLGLSFLIKMLKRQMICQNQPSIT